MDVSVGRQRRAAVSSQMWATKKAAQQLFNRAAFEDSVEPLQLLMGSEQRDIVQAAMAGMNGEDVEILLLKYVHGWDYTRISQQLGLEGHRVAHRLRRARERLKHQLRQRGIGPDVSGHE